MRLRIAVGALGVLGIGFGLLSVLLHLPGKIPLLVVWLAGPLLLHDGVLVPVALGLAWLGRRLLPRRLWGPAVVGLAEAATAVLLALPPLLSPADGTVPGLLDRDYPRGLLIALAVALAVTVAFALLVATLPARAPGDHRKRPAR